MRGSTSHDAGLASRGESAASSITRSSTSSDSNEWRDVYLDYRQFKAVQVKAGTFKLPFGLEENTSSTNLDFIYRTRISSRLAPGRDRGMAVHGRVLRNLVTYEAGVFRHDGDNAQPSASARVFGGPTIAARIVANPFRGSTSAFANLQIGGAISRTNIPLGYPAVRARTVFGASFYDSDVWVKGRRQRTGLEARWRPGRVSLQAEYIRLTDERRGQSVEDGDLSPLLAHGWYRQRHLRADTQTQPRGRRRTGRALRDVEFRQHGVDGRAVDERPCGCGARQRPSCGHGRRQLASSIDG